MLLAICAAGLVGALLIVSGMDHGWRFYDALASFSTLIVALVIWWEESRKALRAQWPKRLSVRFVAPDGQIIWSCKKVYLAGESDIRASGQQIGQQMSGQRWLKFNPGIERTPGRDDRLANGWPCRHYEVTFRLTELPENLPVEVKEGLTRVWDYSSGETNPKEKFIELPREEPQDFLSHDGKK